MNVPAPGLGLDGANYLIKVGARVVGNDTLTFEKRPPIVKEPKFQVFPVHMRLIADSGIYIIGIEPPTHGFSGKDKIRCGQRLGNTHWHD